MTTATNRYKNIAYICTIIFGMLFIFNMLSYIWTKNPFILFVAGLMLGATIIHLIDIPHINCQNRLIKRIFKDWEHTINKYHQSINMNIELSKMVKGGKKHVRKKRINKAME